MTAGSTVAVQDIVARDCAEKPDFAVPWRSVLYASRVHYRMAASNTRLVTPNMLAALNNRENPLGADVVPFQVGVPRGPGCGVGDFQITSGVDWSDPNNPRYPGYGELLDRLINATVAAKEFLEPALEQFPSSHLAAFAAYNLGGGGVAQELAQGLSPDAWTTEHDYGYDVFRDYVDFAAVSFGVNVDWASWHP